MPHLSFADTEIAGLQQRVVRPAPSPFFTRRSFLKDLGRMHSRHTGTHDLAHIRPGHFTPDPSVKSELGVVENGPYAVMRFVGWDAHHDWAIDKPTVEAKNEIVALTAERHKVFISAEGKLPDHIGPMRMRIKPHRNAPAILRKRAMTAGPAVYYAVSPAWPRRAIPLGTLPKPECAVLTLANKITLFRLASIPIFAAAIALYTGEEQWPRRLALGIYVCAALSDAVDGYIARNWNQRSKLGRILDPLADKLLVNVAFVLLAVNSALDTHVPMWLPVLVLLRDAIITGGAYLIQRTYGRVDIQVRVLGKLTTACEFAAIAGVLAQVPIAGELLALMIAVASMSLLDYIVQGIRQVRRKEPA